MRRNTNLPTTRARINRALVEKIAQSRIDRGRGEKPIPRVRQSAGGIASRGVPSDVTGSPAVLVAVTWTGTHLIQPPILEGNYYRGTFARRFVHVSGPVIGQTDWTAEAIAGLRDGEENQIDPEGENA
ncbi:hypothetical protein SAMN06297251_10441 [Fulvimarina manganoxydans]|uniref:Uncharacterized protein n=1 Tax=Fulvimarina manganoxydans TaxID=937218 RepID=A0A1W2A9D9_9HYPH|nr:hypothetical protein [Fulvimarina manganoxydans]SMC57276.1 hypothetical protein SAMN06297251_10441 [Fulvimarina manganoxydans]